MSYLARAFAPLISAISRGPTDDFWYGPVGTMTPSGVAVSPDSSMTIAAVYNAVDIYTKSISTLPLHTYRRMDERSRQRDPRHPLASVVGKQPNPWQTAAEFWGMAPPALLLRGDFFAEIRQGVTLPMVPGQQVAAIEPVFQLYPLHPDRMKVEQDRNGSLRYEYTPDRGPKREIAQQDMLHIRGMTLDGVRGCSVITYARESMGAIKGMELHGATFFKNGITPSGVLQHPGRLSEQAAKRLRDAVKHRHAGPRNAGEPMLLEEGMTWQSISLTNEDAQWLESRAFSIYEVARWFDLPPHMLKAEKSQPRANMEQEALEFVTLSLRPWLVRIEQAIWRDLIIDKQNVYVEFLVDALLRGDIKSRYEAYKTAIEWGFATVNEVREREGMNPVPGGDRRLVPMNMQVIDEDGEPVTPPAAEPAALPAPAPELEPDARIPSVQVLSRLEVLAESMAKRVLMKELARLRHLAKQHAGDEAGWRASVQDFYADHAELVADALHCGEDAARAWCAAQRDDVLFHGLRACETWMERRLGVLVDLAMARVAA